MADVQRMDDILSLATSQQRLATSAATFTAMVAFVVALVGIAGVVGYLVNGRRGELCVRQALGATPVRLLALALKRTLAAAVIGVVLGIWITVTTSEWLTTLVYDVRPTDMTSIVGAGVFLIGACGVAAWIPARRVLSLEVSTLLKDARP